MAPWFGFVIMLGLAAAFTKAADFEDLSYPIAWGGASCLLYLGSVYYLDFGLCGALSMQVLLLLAMMGAMYLEEKRKDSDAESM
jgi:hypothetical protein